METCNGMLCLACASTETPLIALPLNELAKARPVPLRESRSVRQWISGMLGTLQPSQVACMVNVPMPGCPDALAVLYTSGLLSIWEPAAAWHLCQMAVGRPSQPGGDSASLPFSVASLYASGRRADVVGVVLRGTALCRLPAVVLRAHCTTAQHSALACRVACSWPCDSAQSCALLFTQVDELSGIRSTSSTVSAIRLAAAHGGRTATVALLDTLDMLDVAVALRGPVRSAEEVRAAAGSSQEDSCGRLLSAATVDAGQGVVALLMHCDAATRALAVRVDAPAADVHVLGALLGLENALQVRGRTLWHPVLNAAADHERIQEHLLMDVAHAPVHAALHEQACVWLAESCGVAAAGVLDAALPALLSAAHLRRATLALALLHIGCSVPVATLATTPRDALLATVRGAVEQAARQRSASPLAVAAQLAQRYASLRAAESAAVGFVEPHGAAATPAVAIRRGLEVSTLRAVRHPGAALLMPADASCGAGSQHALHALLHAAAAAAGPVLLRWPLQMVPELGVQLQHACDAAARAVAAGVPCGSGPMSAERQQAQVRSRAAACMRPATSRGRRRFAALTASPSRL
jgi:hypothetical protein